MKKTRLIALLLAMLLVLAGCGDSAEQPQGGAASSGTPVLSQEAQEDVVKYLTDGAYNHDTVVGHVGDREITADEVIYWIAYQQYNMIYYYTNYFGFTLNMSDPMDDDMTVGESLYEFGLDTALSYAVAAQKAHEEGVELSDTDAAAVKNLYEDNVKFYGEDRWNAYVKAGLLKEEDFSEEEKLSWIEEHGKEFYAHSMMYYGTTAEAYQRLITDFYYYSAMQDHLFGEGGANAPTEETMKDYMDTYVKDNGVLWGRCILFPTQDKTDEEKAAAKSQSEAVYAELSALSGEALQKAFTEKQTEFDQSGYTAGEIQHYTKNDSLVDGYYDTLEKLTPGQLGVTGETDFGYFILLRESDNEDDIRPVVEKEYINSTYDALVSQWTEDMDAECAMDDLDLDSFYEKLADLQKTLAAVDTVSATEDLTEE